MTREEKQKALEEIGKQVEECRKCPLYQTATHGVPGEGNPDADLFFIGEGPGQKEDELGRPFVGAAGRLLEELLKHIGLTRNDVYIGNVVKHRPPGNRDPLPEELAACWPYLERQLEIIEPKIVVTLGRHSLGRFLPGKVISQVHGKPFRAGGRVYFAMYHPAAALYSGSLKPVLFEDIARLPKVLEKIHEGGDMENATPGETPSASPSPPQPDSPAQGSLL